MYLSKSLAGSLRAVCCLYLATVLSGNAQPGGNEMSLQFVAFPKQLKPAPIELRIGPEKTIEVNTPGHELTQAYKVPDLSVIEVGETVLDEEGEPVFRSYGKAKSVAPKQIVLLIRKGKNHSDGLAVIPIDGRLANFGGASFLFVNASNFGFAGLIGDSKFVLRPGKFQIVKPRPNHAQNICQVTLSYQREHEGGWKKFYDTRWPANEKVRTLAIFYQIPGTDRVGLAPIMEIMNKHQARQDP